MKRRRPHLLVLLALAGCGEDEPLPSELWQPRPEACDAPDPREPRTFSECSTGSVNFGRWTRDTAGFPAYDYELDQAVDPRAKYPVTEENIDGTPLDRRDHWAAFGNSRVNALAFNDGYIELVTQDRGVEYLNKVDAEADAWAGGFGWLSDGEEKWCTAYKWRPKGARSSRRFGMGYAETWQSHRDVDVTRVTTAPAGESAVIVSDVTLENRGETTKHLTHWEYWDVGRRPIEINWLVSGETFTLAPSAARTDRDARNAWFDENVSLGDGGSRLELRRSYVGTEPRPPKGEPSAADYYPNDPFLLSAFGAPTDVFVDQGKFLGASGIALPSAVALDSSGAASSQANGNRQPHLFVMKSEVTLGPGQSRTLRYVYGYARAGEDFPSESRWRDPTWDPRAEYQASIRERLFYFATEDAPELQRELAWHAYQLEASVGYRDYWQSPVLPQGSAYLYLHGADGAARDLGLFAVPLVYTNPELAKAELRMFMGIQFASERFSYAFQGHGMLDDASIHSAPSDLPLFFVWALSEYLGATGDLAFLDEKVPYWPREERPDATTREHLVGALRHLFDVVGTGEHGLIRVGTGDWSDGIVVEAPDRQLAVEKGESVPNTQMAVAVLPRVADLLEADEPILAAEIRTQVTAYRAAAVDAWTGKHFLRAYFGDGVPHGAETLNLESQIWALIGDSFAKPGDRQTLIDGIVEQLDEPSPIGATLGPGAQVWPAISAPLTWGYALTDPERAWKHFTRNTMASHALAFPDVWYGIWSGPDGVGSKDGIAWKSQVTPMTDFPVQNNNYHAMPILAALRMAGIDATATGIAIQPRIPHDNYALASQLVTLERDGQIIRGSYRPTGKTQRTLSFHAPTGTKLTSVRQDGKSLEITAGSAVSLEFDPQTNDELAFEIELGN